MTDEELLRRVAQRDEEAFRALYTRHSAPVFGLLSRLAGRNGDAADLLQETWLRAVRHLSLFRGQSTFSTWLTGIALNCYREWRRRHARDTSLDDPDTRPPLPRAADEMAAMSQRLAALPLEYREVLVLHDIDGFTHEEIAAALEIEPATSKSRLSRARRAFRQRWNDEARFQSPSPDPRSHDDPLLPQEAATLARARVPSAPPEGEEERLVATLRHRGLLRRRPTSHALGCIAAAVVVLIAAAWILWLYLTARVLR